MHDDQSACGRGLWPVYKISSRKWLLRKILKDKFKKWLAGDWVFLEAPCVLETAFLKVLRQKRSMAHSTKCGWESPAYWTSGSKGKLCKRRGFLCSSVGKEFACRWNMYITIREIDHQSKFNEWNRALKVGVLGWPGGMGWETHVHLWLMHVNLWQKPQQYCEVISLQLNWFFFKKGKESFTTEGKKRIFPETRVRFLGQEDSHGEGNGNPLQYSCLENPVDWGACQGYSTEQLNHARGGCSGL